MLRRNDVLSNLLGIEPSLSRLPCLFIICILRTLSANESPWVMVTVSSFCPDCAEFPLEGDRLNVKDSSTAFSNVVAVCRLRTGSWTFTVTSSTSFGVARWPFCASSRSGVDDQEEGLWRVRKGAVTSTTLFSFVDKFCVDVQLRTDLSSPSRFRLGVDEAISSLLRVPCSL